jgi:hypothetical protein
MFHFQLFCPFLWCRFQYQVSPVQSIEEKTKTKERKKTKLPPYVDDLMDYDHKAALLLDGLVSKDMNIDSNGS